MDAIVTENIPAIVEKYTEKGKILDDCEERHKRLTAKLEEQNDEFDKKLEALEKSISGLGGIDPKQMARRGSFNAGIPLEELAALRKQ